MIRIELFDPQKHYETVCQWWAAQGWPKLPLTHLPQTGVIVFSGDSPAAAGWIYKTDSAYCWLEYIVANPDVRGEARASAISTLVSSAKCIAKVMGFQSCIMWLENESLAKRISAHGFEPTDKGVTGYSCDLRKG